MRASAHGLVLLVGLAACEAVPGLTFVQADARPADAPDVADAADATAVDAADATDERATQDARPDALPPADGGAEAEAGCPGSLPPGASVCCGPVACDLNCVPMLCMMCQMMCKDELCCAKNNNVVCQALGSTCH